MLASIGQYAVPAEIVLALLGCVLAGVAVGEFVCRTQILHRRARVRTLVATLYVCFLSAVVVFVGPEMSPVQSHPWLMGGAVCAVSAMFGPLRRFFAYALIGFETGELVRIGLYRGTVVYYSWTGLELSTGGQTVIIPVLDLYDVVITRFPERKPDNRF